MRLLTLVKLFFFSLGTRQDIKIYDFRCEKKRNDFRCEKKVYSYVSELYSTNSHICAFFGHSEVRISNATMGARYNSISWLHKFIIHYFLRTFVV
ncbi:hypothetical protein M5D96_006610 [Drosophila gunungcola]|uniref:Uncharacterized protein n=1 Tax=Drosophila gunungcola TaxID=103775 RepID=A0A9Q0BQ69_9MUSC|nr:hypothetical protein M5D96_006610 [Drosophila gunungcola]